MFRSVPSLSKFIAKFCNLAGCTTIPTRSYVSKEKLEFPLEMDLGGKIAIITGGESGIGLAAAEEFLSNGAKIVVLAGIGDGEPVVKRLNDEYGEGKSCFMNMDVNDPRDFEELMYRVDLVYGGIDILFNNAGIMQDHVWEYEVDTNLKSVIKGTLLGLDYMGKEGRGKRKGKGVIINHSDVFALDALPVVPVYVATKAGIIYATLSFGDDYHYDKTDVRVMGLVTGPTNTHMVRDCSDKQLNPAWGRDLNDLFVRLKPVDVKSVGKAVSHVAKYGPPGSMWVVNNGALSLTDLKCWRKSNTFVTQF